MRYMNLRKIIIQALLIFPLMGLPQSNLKAEIWGGFEILNPLANPSLVVIYDFVGKETLAGLEGAFLQHEAVPNWSLTAGALTDFNGEGDGELRERSRDFVESGTFFFGTRYDVAMTENIHVGFAYGRNLEEGKNIVGIKTSYNIRFW